MSTPTTTAIKKRKFDSSQDDSEETQYTLKQVVKELGCLDVETLIAKYKLQKDIITNLKKRFGLEANVYDYQVIDHLDKARLELIKFDNKNPDRLNRIRNNCGELLLPYGPYMNDGIVGLEKFVNDNINWGIPLVVFMMFEGYWKAGETKKFSYLGSKPITWNLTPLFNKSKVWLKVVDAAISYIKQDNPSMEQVTMEHFKEALYTIWETSEIQEENSISITNAGTTFYASALQVEDLESVMLKPIKQFFFSQPAEKYQKSIDALQ